MDDDITPKQGITSIAARATDHSVESGIDPHSNDHKTRPSVTKKELFSYYTYYAGNNGIGSFQ